MRVVFCFETFASQEISKVSTGTFGQTELRVSGGEYVSLVIKVVATIWLDASQGQP
ncbi:hypothetical protein SeSPB_A0272 [Salmonella enterica subsp. enterica serovar Saintpaul str. SARA29]|nr:hypothetical protein SeSPB_A0272 [Salmonella enterica subsp. enterica serovar Saintpaul str. SARA29]